MRTEPVSLMREYPGAVLTLAPTGTVKASNGILEAQLGRSLVDQPLSVQLSGCAHARLRQCLTAPRPGDSLRLAFRGDSVVRRRFLVLLTDPANGELWLVERLDQGANLREERADRRRQVLGLALAAAVDLMGARAGAVYRVNETGLHLETAQGEEGVFGGQDQALRAALEQLSGAALLDEVEIAAGAVLLAVPCVSVRLGRVGQLVFAAAPHSCDDGALRDANSLGLIFSALLDCLEQDAVAEGQDRAALRLGLAALMARLDEVSRQLGGNHLAPAMEELRRLGDLLQS